MVSSEQIRLKDCASRVHSEFMALSLENESVITFLICGRLRGFILFSWAEAGARESIRSTQRISLSPSFLFSTMLWSCHSELRCELQSALWRNLLLWKVETVDSSRILICSFWHCGNHVPECASPEEFWKTHPDIEESVWTLREAGVSLHLSLFFIGKSRNHFCRRRGDLNFASQIDSCMWP